MASIDSPTGLSSTPQSSDDQAVSLGSVFAERMRDAWHNGDCRTAEELLLAHPELQSDPEAIVRVIYEEICLRESRGELDAVGECLRRYPQWRTGIETVMACHRWLSPLLAEPTFPVVGEILGESCIVRELGRGAHGRVYLADQADLASRLVVLKVIPFSSIEHLKLARLQHTNIVPLYSVRDLSDRGLRMLCMPYLAGATLDKLLLAIRSTPWPQRSGKTLVDAMDALDNARPTSFPAQGPARKFLQSASYVDAVCWIGVCLADAVQYAHEQNLLHLDIKPSNVLLTADGRPMLLDFHLARRPVQPKAEFPDGIGGTPRYMSPEQKSGWEAARKDRPIPHSIDARSDLYALGLVLRECLVENVGRETDVAKEALFRQSPIGLRDIVARCLEPEVGKRYSSALDLSNDLRRQIAHLPLRGVRNRSWTERWTKWRQRSPHAVLTVALAAIVVVLMTAFVFFAWYEWHDRWIDANSALAKARGHVELRQFQKAERECDLGLQRLGRLAQFTELGDLLRSERTISRQGQAIKELSVFLDKIRYVYADEDAPPALLAQVAERCQEAWEHRETILDAALFANHPELDAKVRSDLTDIAILWTDAKRRLAESNGREISPNQSLESLKEAERVLGSSVVLREEMRRYLGDPEDVEPLLLDSRATAWEWYAAGRARMTRRDYDEASRRFQRAVEIDPGEFWPHFHLGLCNYRLERYDAAREDFQIAIALRPESAECFYNRALAYMGLHNLEKARDDLQRALSLDPSFALAKLNLGVVYLLEGKLNDAKECFADALRLGADPGMVHYNLALVCRANNDRAGALANLELALHHDQNLSQAAELKTTLKVETEGEGPAP